MIATCHIPYYQDIFAIPEFLTDPILVFGFNETNHHPVPSLWQRFKWRVWLALDLRRYKLKIQVTDRTIKSIPEAFKKNYLHETLKELGVSAITTLDHFDPRSDVKADMNLPIPESLREQFNTVIDIGNLEHVFDTKQCLHNLFEMLRIGGHILIHTPVSGYFNHGMHTHSPECILGALESNGFDLKYIRFSTPEGMELSEPSRACDTILWVVARKTRSTQEFICPQQKRWVRRYKDLHKQ